MQLNYDQVKELWFAEDMDFYMATQDQVDQLCEELGHDMPQMRWDDYQEEIQSLYFEAVREMEMEF